MNSENEAESGHDQPEVQKKKRKSYTTIDPAIVNDVEDPRAYLNMLERLFLEFSPRNFQQEGDLISLAQLRWAAERIHNLMEVELNMRLRLPNVQNVNDSSTRLLTAYRNCLIDKTYLPMNKQYLDTLKTMNSLSTRIDRWAVSKPVNAKSRQD